MIRYILLFFSIFQLSNLYSQGYTLTFEKEDKNEKNYPVNINIKSDGSAVLVGSSKANVFTRTIKELTITNYNSSMENIGRVKIKTKEFDDMEYEMSYPSKGDNVYLIFSDYDSKSKSKTYYTYKLNSDGTADKSSKTKLFTSKVTSSDDGELVLLMSEDKSQKYIRYIAGLTSVFVNKNSLRLLKIKGENEIEWDKTLIKETIKRDKEIIDVIMANHGEILVHYTSRKNDDDARITNQYSLYNNVGEFVSTSSAESKGKYYDNIKFVANKDGSFNIYGFYSDDKSLKRFHGISGFNYSTVTNQFNKVFEFHLDADLLSNIMKQSKAEKLAENGVPSDYKLRNIFGDDKGNFIIAAEEEYIDENTLIGKKTSTSKNAKGTFINSLSPGITGPGFTNMNGGYQKRDLINGKVLIFSLSPDGKILWSNSILKEQSYQITSYSGYASISSQAFDKLPLGIYGFDDKDYVYFFLNDKEGNVKYQVENENEKKKTKTMSNIKSANTYVYKFSKSDGSKSVSELFNGKDNQLIIYPRTTFKVNNSRYIVYAQTLLGGNDALGLLTINNPSSSPSEKPMKQENMASNSSSDTSHNIVKNESSTSTKTTNPSSSSAPAPTAKEVATGVALAETGVSGTSKTDTSIKFEIPDAKMPINTAVSNGVPMVEYVDAAAPRELKYKADEKDVDHFKDLRVKFQQDSVIAAAKAKDSLAKAQAEALKEFNSRHTTPQQQTEFEQFRYGDKKNTPPKKEENPQDSYNDLFK